MAFVAGQKVVCVNDGTSLGHFGLFCGPAYEVGFRKGSVYTVAFVNYDLIGIVGMSGEWNPLRFRLIVDNKTDISVFKKLLLPIKELV